jgi:hypothetical protein
VLLAAHHASAIAGYLGFKFMVVHALQSSTAFLHLLVVNGLKLDVTIGWISVRRTTGCMAWYLQDESGIWWDETREAPVAVGIVTITQR